MWLDTSASRTFCTLILIFTEEIFISHVVDIIKNLYHIFLFSPIPLSVHFTLSGLFHYFFWDKNIYIWIIHYLQSNFLFSIFYNRKKKLHILFIRWLLPLIRRLNPIDEFFSPLSHPPFVYDRVLKRKKEKNERKRKK